MTSSTQLNDKWIKASIIGTIWASSEIVLGSFLHNLRVPFSGNILTAIGLVILISASYKWKDKGLFWRAGVICALLKTMSPSAVIFGPMIAILSEAFLLEFSVRILGRTIPGFVLGSVLAMSWNLLQKIANFILFYGYNIVEIYTNLMEYAQRQLRLQFDAVWTPLILLLIIYALFGAFSAFIGIKTGRKLSGTFLMPASKNQTNTDKLFQKKRDSTFNYSIGWLSINLILMIAPLLLIGKIHFGLWVIMVAAIATAWAIRYKRALRQLVRPKLWIFFVLITMITAFVFTRLQSESMTTFNAVLIGFEMNMRAILLIMGFSVLGTELYHPKIRNFLAGSYFKQLPLALELSLESLPTMIAGVPNLKSIVKNPVQVIYQMMAHAEGRIHEIKGETGSKIIIVTGKQGVGKTTCLQKLVEKCKAVNKKTSGIITPRLITDGLTSGYEVVDISSEDVFPFLKIEGNKNQQKIGRYYIDNHGLESVRQVLKNIDNPEIIFIDEIGNLELSGRGWSEEFQPVFQKNAHIVLSVRKDSVDKVIEKWNLKPAIVLEITEINNENVVEKIAILLLK